MNVHKQLRKVYGENVCTACGKSWEDGDEVPVCDDEHPRVEHDHSIEAIKKHIGLTPGTVYHRNKAGETKAAEPEFSCWLMLSANGFAMVGYARNYSEALALAHRWAGNKVTEVRQWLDQKAPAEIEKPYLELSPYLVKSLDIAHGQTLLKIVSPVYFKKVA
ncbi:hypothetical protein JT321_gp01 [Providencia phage Kokobel1]|uniref:Uncharacterized protein n=1 Tax=Providencia phage Kokobel1 TaxID=2783540 RepID=A0A873WQQ6_9CAUD|nr:hypothetical protein JT321_gp01 [Providencia phage Kokobel1]QPB11428.1 hypothetical protein [Providencia phage Kokobel1]